MPRGRGIVMTTLRPPTDMLAEQEVFAGIGEGPLDSEMVELAGIIMERRAGHFEPAKFHEGYQAALHRLIEEKLRGEKIEPPKPRPPAPVDGARGKRSQLPPTPGGHGRLHVLVREA